MLPNTNVITRIPTNPIPRQTHLLSEAELSFLLARAVLFLDILKSLRMSWIIASISSWDFLWHEQGHKQEAITGSSVVISLMLPSL